MLLLLSLYWVDADVAVAAAAKKLTKLKRESFGKFEIKRNFYYLTAMMPADVVLNYLS